MIPIIFPPISALPKFLRSRRDGKRCYHFANIAVALDPSNDPQAYFFAAGAYFALHKLDEAEKSALRAAEIDRAKREPRMHFLLAQIYEVERKPDAEAVQLREYPKSVTDPQEVATVKKYLADLTGNSRQVLI